MTLPVPTRNVWLVIGMIVLFLLQSGCQPIQPPNPDESRAGLDTDITTKSPSPDGAWIATTRFQVASDSQTYYQRLAVTHTSGTPSYTLIDVEGPFGLGYTVVEPLMWSEDGNRFYFTNRPQADGCGLLFNGSDLHKVDLATGDSTELLPANATTTLALAPDETHVAFLTMGRMALILHDLNSGESIDVDLTPLLEQQADEARPQVGAFTWSPDGSALAFVVAHNPCIGGWAASTSIYVLDTASLTVTPILERDDRVLSPVAWLDAATLLVENQVFYDRIDQKRPYTLDLTTSTVALVE